MPDTARVPLPPCEAETDPETIADGIAAWVGSEPMSDLLAAFGGALPGSSTGANLAYLDEFSAEHWDFRGGRERYETEAERLDPPAERLVIDAAAALGLAGRTEPPRRRYTHLLVLGGLVSSCLFRTAFAARLVSDGTAVEQITGIGGFRPLGEADERVAAASGLPRGRFEIDAMEHGLEQAFGLHDKPHVEVGGDPDTDPGRAWRIAAYDSQAVNVRAVAAPSSRPDLRRADTVDTCRFWAEQVADLAPGDSVLVVTSALFVPFQHCDAVAHVGLPYRCAIDTVGVDSASVPQVHLRKEYTSSGYLQEIRSAIRSMRRLFDHTTQQVKG